MLKYIQFVNICLFMQKISKTLKKSFYQFKLKEDKNLKSLGNTQRDFYKSILATQT